MIYYVNTANPAGPWLRVIDPKTGDPIPASRVDTCEMRVYQANTSRPRNFYLRVDADAPDDFKALYPLFA